MINRTGHTGLKPAFCIRGARDPAWPLISRSVACSCYPPIERPRHVVRRGRAFGRRGGEPFGYVRLPHRVGEQCPSLFFLVFLFFFVFWLLFFFFGLDRRYRKSPLMNSTEEQSFLPRHDPKVPK